jgi:hypothetical protein
MFFFGGLTSAHVRRNFEPAKKFEKNVRGSLEQGGVPPLVRCEGQACPFFCPLYFYYNKFSLTQSK